MSTKPTRITRRKAIHTGRWSIQKRGGVWWVVNSRGLDRPCDSFATAMRITNEHWQAQQRQHDRYAA